MLEDTYAAATKGASDYGLKVIESARENTNAAFDFASQLMTVKSLAEVVELSTAHSRKQFEALTAQSKELAAIAQKVADRDRRAGEGELRQGVQEGRLTIAPPSDGSSVKKPGLTARAFCLIASDELYAPVVPAKAGTHIPGR